jgi:hypothetical protein
METKKICLMYQMSYLIKELPYIYQLHRRLIYELNSWYGLLSLLSQIYSQNN